MSKRTSTLGTQLRRYLNRVLLYLEAALKELRVHLYGPPTTLATLSATCQENRFFFIVVEVPDANTAVIALLESKTHAAAAIRLPEGCRFRTCYEIAAEYAKMIINM